jgi:hypothetical protein
VKDDAISKACSTNGEQVYIYDMVGKPERNKQLGRSKRMWVYDIELDLSGMGWNEMDRSDLV